LTCDHILYKFFVRKVAEVEQQAWVIGKTSLIVTDGQ
jgi:hypothetical protein